VGAKRILCLFFAVVADFFAQEKATLARGFDSLSARFFAPISI